jgi:cation diffusion facilitator CzcD-associated flavoprotein CzcO
VPIGGDRELMTTIEQLSDTRVEHRQVAIIGTGFGGLGAAIRLKRDGIEDIVLLERAGDVGGVWRENSYPGCAVDVQSHLYSFSFAPNPEWGRVFAAQPEIHGYLRRCADEFDVSRHIRFRHTVEQLRWAEDAQRWELTTSQGSLTADHVVIAAGALADPVIPALPGMGSFAGERFHSARWNHDYDLVGKRVAVIGTGASAIQFVPAIQPQVGKLTLFQRTAPWVTRRHDRPITAKERSRLRRFPLLQRALRLTIYLQREALVIGFRNPGMMKLAERRARKHLAAQVKDPELRAKLTPDYRLGCKRILISNTYLRALDQPNAAVVTSGIREIRARSVVDNDGVEHPVDAIIFGTGFHASEMPITRRVHGRDGRTLSQTWAGSPRAYLGTTVAGFPNAYLIHGPNIGLGHSSVIHMFESQINYISDAISLTQRLGIAALEPTEDAQDEFNALVDKQMQGTVWTAGGCTSWYLDKTGRNSSLWPGFTLDYRRRTRRVERGDHILRPRVANAVAA